MNFFDKIPLITYDGNLCRNLLARARLSDGVRSQKEAFYPYAMESGDRADVVSNDYYSSPGYTWLIWMTNNHVDPYFDMVLSEDDFNSFIIKKYGSVEQAARKIKYYRNNWYEKQEDKISVVQFDSLIPSHKKYYEPILGTYLDVVGYKRKPDDTIVNTNRVQTVILSSVSGTFVVGEEVQTNGNNYGFVTGVSDRAISIQHITGTLSGTIAGQESGATATVVSTNNVSTTLAAVDPTFWTSVTFYEYEQELNEQKRNIRLLDPRFAKQAENDLRKIMSAR